MKQPIAANLSSWALSTSMIKANVLHIYAHILYITISWRFTEVYKLSNRIS